MRCAVTEDADAAVSGIPDGATVLVGGFGIAGMPVMLTNTIPGSTPETSRDFAGVDEHLTVVEI